MGLCRNLLHLTFLKIWLTRKSYALGPLKNFWYSRPLGKACAFPTRSFYHAGIINREKKVSFNIDPNDPLKIEALSDENNIKQYQLVARGTECYTYPNPAIYKFFGVFVVPVVDPEPENPLTTSTCKVQRFVLPTGMIPCDPITTYLSIEDIFYFKFNSLRMTYDEIKPESRFQYSTGNIKKYFILNIGMPSSLDPQSYFDDDFMEMLVAQPFRQINRVKLPFSQKIH